MDKNYFSLSMEKTARMSSDACSRSGFTLIHQNIRSLKNKKEEFDIFLRSLHADPDAILFTETWLCNIDMSPEFPNYSVVRLDRAGRGGGLAIYMKQQYSFQVLDGLSMSSGDIECLAIETNSFLLTVVYRPPTGYKRRFLSHLEQLMHCFNDIKNHTSSWVM